MGKRQTDKKIWNLATEFQTRYWRGPIKFIYLCRSSVSINHHVFLKQDSTISPSGRISSAPGLGILFPAAITELAISISPAGISSRISLICPSAAWKMKQKSQVLCFNCGWGHMYQFVVFFFASDVTYLTQQQVFLFFVPFLAFMHCTACHVRHIDTLHFIRHALKPNTTWN